MINYVVNVGLTKAVPRFAALATTTLRGTSTGYNEIEKRNCSCLSQVKYDSICYNMFQRPCTFCLFPRCVVSCISGSSEIAFRA